MNREIVLFDSKINCCGCWACENICPNGAVFMSADEHGFLFPAIDSSKCVKCGLCLKVCPIKKRDREISEESQKPHIKIINYGTADNFGAAITAVCLEQKVKSLVPDDYVVQTIDYDSYAESWNKSTQRKNQLRARAEFVNLGLEKLNLKSKKDAEKETFSHSYSALRNHRYNKFRNHFLNFTVKKDNYDLDRDTDNNVALICGSDVIWFPPRVKFRSSKGFYLDFGDKNVKRIAFAASLDSKVNFSLLKKWFAYKKHLKKFDAISVRESADIKFIQSMTKKEVKKIVDPVFLYEPSEFDPMLSISEEKMPDEEYIYAYILMNNDKAYEYTLKLAKEKNLRICYFADFYKDFGENSVDCYDDGPAEFLNRIKNAKYVVTTSFHCIVFSLIFKKQFLAFDRGNNSIKIPDILETFGIPERLVKPNESRDIDDPIDFDKTDRLIEKYRTEAVNYLKESLNM